MNTLILLGLLTYIFQYTGLDYKFFKNNFSFHYRLTFGRFAEGFPNAVTGLYIASKNYTITTIYIIISGSNNEVNIYKNCFSN